MIKNMQILSFLFLLAQLSLSQTAVVPSAGDGTEENPYQIATLENLYWITADPTNWNYNYKQTADINAAETKTWFDGQGWLPIGRNQEDFDGEYDGNGFVIDSLFIYRPIEEQVGLFGLVGSTITNLGVTNLNITGGTRVGGIIGLAPGGGLLNCYSSGIISADSGFSYAGGLIGWSGSVFKCYSEAEVSGNHAGGLIGSPRTGVIVNSYSTGKISGNIVGGLSGDTYDCIIMNSYFAGSVNGSVHAGGLAGLAAFELYIYNSFWNSDSIGILTNDSGNGKTTEELKNPNLYVNSPWDSTIWSMDEGFNNGYPYLAWQNPDGTPLPGRYIKKPNVGDGTIENPYQIETLKNLYWVTLNPEVFRDNFLQTADINASGTREMGNGEGWIPIGMSKSVFRGRYNGNGHIIDSLFINRPFVNSQGLFGLAYFLSSIKNLGITNVDISGNNSVGGLCGSSDSNIESCYSTGKVNGSGENIGGLAGNFSHGIVNNCYSMANVSGGSIVGGLVGRTGRLEFPFDHCYSTGAVSGNSNIGGLIGSGSGILVTNSFWDIQSSGQETSSGGVGKLTAEMKSVSTFSDAGWHPEFWQMDSSINDGYPHLSWQNPGGTPIPLIAKLGMMTRSLEFGSITQDTSEASYTNITNTGYDTLRIINIISTNENFIFSPESMNIAPSDSVYLWVTFIPQDTLEQTGYIVLTSNAASAPDSLAVSGRRVILTDIDEEPVLPASFSISQNYPNPFNPNTTITFTIPKAGHVSLKVFNMLGQEVATLIDDFMTPQTSKIEFDGSSLASGVYLYRLESRNNIITKKMILIK